jgi:hypothetical protein
VLGTVVLQAEQLRASKPTKVDNSFSHVEVTEEGLVIHDTRFKNRVRRSDTVTLMTSVVILLLSVLFVNRLK